MSVKVWEAYRLRKGFDLWEVLRDIRLRAEKDSLKVMAKWYAAQVKHWTESPQDMLEAMRALYVTPRPSLWEIPEMGPADPKKREEWEEYAKKRAAETPTTMHARDYIRFMYQFQKSRGEKNTFDLDMCVVVRRYKGRYLLVPYPGSGMLGGVLKFLKRHPALEDYHYQNQSDKSSKCSMAEWEERGKAWDVLLDDDRFHDKLALDIVTPEGFERIDPWFQDLIRRAKRKDQQDTREHKRAQAKAKKMAKKAVPSPTEVAAS